MNYVTGKGTTRGWGKVGLGVSCGLTHPPSLYGQMSSAEFPENMDHSTTGLKAPQWDAISRAMGPLKHNHTTRGEKWKRCGVEAKSAHVLRFFKLQYSLVGKWNCLMWKTLCTRWPLATKAWSLKVAPGFVATLGFVCVCVCVLLVLKKKKKDFYSLKPFQTQIKVWQRGGAGSLKATGQKAPWSCPVGGFGLWGETCQGEGLFAGSVNVRSEQNQHFYWDGVTGGGAGCIWGLLQGGGDGHVKGLSRWVWLAGSGPIRAAERQPPQPHQEEPLYRVWRCPWAQRLSQDRVIRTRTAEMIPTAKGRLENTETKRNCFFVCVVFLCFF